jgi:hypothetical protein
MMVGCVGGGSSGKSKTDPCDPSVDTKRCLSGKFVQVCDPVTSTWDTIDSCSDDEDCVAGNECVAPHEDPGPDVTPEPDTSVDIGHDDIIPDAVPDVSVDIQVDGGLPDLSEPDPCDPFPCPAAYPTCDGDTKVEYSAPVCQNVDGAALCSYQEEKTLCDQCINGQCVTVGDPKDYIFGDVVSVITTMAIGGVSDAEPCCFDYTGDGEIDNALGKLLKGLGNILGDTDVNVEITDSLQSGSTILLIEYSGLNDLDAGSFVANLFYGEDTDFDYADNLMGVGDFSVDPESFIPGTAIPAASMPNGVAKNALISAGPGVFQLAFPIGNIKLNTKVSAAMLQANATIGPNGVGLSFQQGQLGGAITMDDLYAALNAYSNEECDCLGLGGDLITFDPDKGKMACASTENSSCDSNDPDEDTCAQFGSFCGAALLFLKPDLDLDDDGEKDAMSLGLWLDATSATIVGLSQ